MEKLTITPPDTHELIAKANDLTGQAQMLEIVDNDTYELAGKLAVEIKEWIKVVEGKFAESCDAAFKAHRAITAFRNDTLKPYQAAQEAVNAAMGDYRRQVQAKRQQEAAKAQAEALRKAEEARKKEIEAAKAAGDKEGAKNLKAAPLAPVVVAIKTPEPPNVKGVTVRKVWKFTVIDPLKVPRQYLVVDEVAVRKVVNALGANHGIPGISAQQVEVQ